MNVCEAKFLLLSQLAVQYSSPTQDKNVGPIRHQTQQGQGLVMGRDGAGGILVEEPRGTCSESLHYRCPPHNSSQRAQKVVALEVAAAAHALPAFHTYNSAKHVIYGVSRLILGLGECEPSCDQRV